MTLDDDACEHGRMRLQPWFAAAPAAPTAKVNRPAVAKAQAKTKASGATTVHQFKHCHGCVQSQRGWAHDVSQRKFQWLGCNWHFGCRDRARPPGLVPFDLARIARRVEKLQ
ncbi:MAG: hypothetical protein KGH73_09640 [Xanthomonadaceae bacterium]|nr:hypothetical protein [Xanthomonadaceae bacterium]